MNGKNGFSSAAVLVAHQFAFNKADSVVNGNNTVVGKGVAGGGVETDRAVSSELEITGTVTTELQLTALR